MQSYLFNPTTRGKNVKDFMQICEVLQGSRYQHLNRPASSIEVLSLKKDSGNNNTSIETTVLPNEIKQLITGSEFWVKAKTNRYLKLCREGHTNFLLTLAAEAMKKNNPANWFAHSASKALWEDTLKRFTAFKAKVKEVTKTAVMVAEKLGTPVTKFIYKQIWRGINVIRWADEAKDIGRDKAKYFAWLCKRELAMGTAK